jgi:hypothetical protein
MVSCWQVDGRNIYSQVSGNDNKHKGDTFPIMARYTRHMSDGTNELIGANEATLPILRLIPQIKFSFSAIRYFPSPNACLRDPINSTAVRRKNSAGRGHSVG